MRCLSDHTTHACMTLATEQVQHAPAASRQTNTHAHSTHLRATRSAPPLSQHSSSFTGKLARRRSASISAFGSSPCCVTSAVEGCCSDRVRASTTRAADMLSVVCASRAGGVQAAAVCQLCGEGCATAGGRLCAPDTTATVQCGHKESIGRSRPPQRGLLCVSNRTSHSRQTRLTPSEWWLAEAIAPKHST
jgi:hypothetical protein